MEAAALTRGAETLLYLYNRYTPLHGYIITLRGAVATLPNVLFFFSSPSLSSVFNFILSLILYSDRIYTGDGQLKVKLEGQIFDA